MSDFKISFNVNFAVDAVGLLNKGMALRDIFDIVHENLAATDYYKERIKEGVECFRHRKEFELCGDTGVFDVIPQEILQELDNTPIADLEQFIEIHPEQIFCDANAHEQGDYANDEIVFGVGCEFDFGNFATCYKRKLEDSQKKEMSLDRAKQLLGFFVDHECVGENTNTSIQKLLSIGMTEEEIQNFGFSAEDIEYAKESEEEPEI